MTAESMSAYPEDRWVETPVTMPSGGRRSSC